MHLIPSLANKSSKEILWLSCIRGKVGAWHKSHQVEHSKIGIVATPNILSPKPDITLIYCKNVHCCCYLGQVQTDMVDYVV